jgi:hypothetical protein
MSNKRRQGKNTELKNSEPQNIETIKEPENKRTQTALNNTVQNKNRLAKNDLNNIRNKGMKNKTGIKTFRDRHSIKESAFDTNTVIKVLVIAAMGIIPILVRCIIQYYASPHIDPLLYLFTTGRTDYFTYLKFIVLLVISVILLALFLLQVFRSKSEFKSSKLNMLLGVFTLSVIISMLLSDYKTISLWGGYSRNFGVLAYLCCAVLLLVVANTKYDAKWRNYTVNALYLFVVINAVFLILNFYGYELIQNGLIRTLIAGKIEHFQGTGTQLTGTLGHNDFTSGAGGVFFLIFAAKAVFSEKKIQMKAAAFAAALLSGLTVYASQAESGVVTIIFGAVVLYGLLAEQKNYQGTLEFSGLLMLTPIFWFVMSRHNAAFLGDLKGDLGFLLVSAVAGVVILAVYWLWKSKRKLSPRNFRITVISAVVIAIIATAVAGPMATHKINQQYQQIDSQAIAQKLQQNEFDLPAKGVAWGSGRIYIWEETLKLVTQKPLFGYGFDTLPITFNQGDPAKMAALNSATVIVDKTHNMFLNMMYGGGIISFLAYILIILLVLVKSAQTIANGGNKYLLIPVFLGILGYLYQGLFNDQVQGFESVFWVLLGLAYSMATEEKLEEN